MAQGGQDWAVELHIMQQRCSVYCVTRFEECALNELMFGVKLASKQELAARMTRVEKRHVFRGRAM